MRSLAVVFEFLKNLAFDERVVEFIVNEGFLVRIVELLSCGVHRTVDRYVGWESD